MKHGRIFVCTVAGKPAADQELLVTVLKVVVIAFFVLITGIVLGIILRVILRIVPGIVLRVVLRTVLGVVPGLVFTVVIILEKILVLIILILIRHFRDPPENCLMMNLQEYFARWGSFYSRKITLFQKAAQSPHS